MIRRAAIALSLLCFVWPEAGAGQEVQAEVTAQRLTFAKPAGVGIREYDMTATTFGFAVPVGSRVTLGARFAHAGARMRSSIMDVEHSGLTDPEVWLAARVGPVAVRAEFLIGAGSGTGSWTENLVEGLAGYDLLPLAVRSWGRGGGYALETRLPLHVHSAVVELLAATRDHGAYSPYSDDDFEYELGAEHRFGIRIAQGFTAFTGVEVGASVALPKPDRIGDGTEAFDPGTRVDAYSVLRLALPRTTALLSGVLSLRASGTATPALGEALGTSTPDAEARQLLVVGLETRTVAPLPILVTVMGRLSNAADVSWFLTAGLGTELEIRGPWAGRFFLLPGAKIHRGHVAFVESYESSVGGLELSLGGRWSR